MTPRPTQQQKDDTEFREKVRSIDQTIQEVIKPTMTGMAEDIRTIVNKDFLTKAEADKKFVTKEEFKQVKVLFWAIVTAVLLGVVQLAFKFLERGGK